ncbi:MAG: hypothetical protein V4555_06480 [Acidobacteriota bacterium]
MKKLETGRKIAGMLRAAAVMVCICGLAAAAAQAQDPAPAAPPAGAQQGPPAGGRGGMMMDPEKVVARLTKVLGLTADQQTQLTAVYTAQVEKMKANPDMSRQERRAAREAMEAKVKAVLTPDQQTKYADMQAKMRERRGAGGGGEQGPPPSTPPPPPGL